MNRILNPPFVLLLLVLAYCGSTNLPASAQEDGPEIQSLAQALNEAQVYDYGDSGAAMAFIRAEVIRVQQNPEARNDLARTLAALLADGGSSDAFKHFVCTQLYLIGGEEQIDALAPLLRDPRFAHVARYALEVVPSPRVDDLLWDTIPQVDGAVAVGMVSSLAARNSAGTVTRLSQLLPHENSDVVRAALIGLGRFGGREADMVLRQARELLPESYRVEIFEAMLACADGFARDGVPLESLRIYQDLSTPDLPLAVRLGAFHGIVTLQGDGALPLLQGALASGELPWVAAACGYVRTLGGPALTESMGAHLAQLAPETQVPLILALAERRDPRALPYLLSTSDAGDPSVYQAVLTALGDLGNETHVYTLIDALLAEDEVIAEVARASLVRMADAGVNGALLMTLDDYGPDAHPALMAVLAERRATMAVPRLLEIAGSGDVASQSPAFNALGTLAVSDDVPELCRLVLEMVPGEQRDNARGALAMACRRIPAGTARTELLTGLYDSGSPATAQGDVLKLYRELGDDTLLPIVINATQSSDPEVREQAMDVLVGWPTATPMAEVMALISTDMTPDRRDEILSGYVRMGRLATDISMEERLKAYRSALGMSESPELARAVLAGLSELTSAEALDFSEGLMARTDIRREAAIAAEKIRRNFYTVTASENNESAGNVVDGDINSRWDSGPSQTRGQWIEVDMSRPVRIKGIELDNARSRDAYPQAYTVYLFSAESSESVAGPGGAVVRGEGAPGLTKIEFEAQVGQRIRVVQTGENESRVWSVNEIRILPD